MLALATGRVDVKSIESYLLDKKVMYESFNINTPYENVKMPVADWDDERDISYHLWKHKKKGDILEYSSEEDTAAIIELNEKLTEFASMLKGDK